jgi:hypothetical protein
VNRVKFTYEADEVNRSKRTYKVENTGYLGILDPNVAGDTVGLTLPAAAGGYTREY